MPAPKTRTRYSRAKPLGLRSSRARAAAPRVRPQKSVKTPRPAARVRLRSSVRPTRIRHNARVAARATAKRLHRFFNHALATSAGLLVLLVVTSATLTTRAQSSTTAYRALPTACTGWEYPERATSIEALSNAVPSDEVSAIIASRKPDAPAGVDTLLKCRSFALPEDFPDDAGFTDPALVVSMAVDGADATEDVLVLESSLDGEQWTKLESFFVTQTESNVTRGGYWRYALPTLTRDALGTLQFRARFVTVPSETSVRVRFDGVGVDVGAKPVVQREALVLPKDTVTVDKAFVAPTDEPVVSVKVSTPSRLKFLGFKGTERTVEDVQVTDPDGKVVAASFDVTNVETPDGTVAKYAIHTDSFSKPGTYTAAFKLVEGNKEAIATSEFAWGVLVINMNKSVYWPGETVFFGMGVVGPDGHTICDAQLTLRVKAPDGTTTEQTTEQTEKGVLRSGTCGPDNVTDVADYSAEYDTFDAGTYEVTLTAKTQSGEYTITDAVVVSPVIPLAISRHGSMRIYPPAAYTMAVDVRPQQDFKGIVEEYVPPSFQVLKVSDGGVVIKGQQRTTIRWFLEIPDHTLKTLTYRYDAPDISPELFRLGPLQVRSSPDSPGPQLDVQESRQWQIASDAVNPNTAGRLWTAGFELNSVTVPTNSSADEYWSNVNTPAIDTSPVRTGTYSMETALGGASTEGAKYRFATANSLDDYYFRAYIRVTTCASTLSQIMLIENISGTDVASIRMNSNCTLELWDEDTSAGQIGSDSSALSTGTWYRLELRVDCTSTCAGAGTATVNARIDGTTFASSTTANFTTGITDFSWGILQSATGEYNWDDMAVNNDANTDENWPDEGKVVYLRPTSDGTNEGWRRQSDSAACNTIDCSALVSETPPSHATSSVVECSASGQNMDFNLTDAATVGITANDQIKILQPYVRHGASSTLSHNLSYALYNGATDNDASGTVTVALANANSWYNNADDGAAQNSAVNAFDYPGAASTTYDNWTTTTLDAATIRLGSPSDCSPTSRVTAVWVAVEYSTPDTGRLWSSGLELGVASPPAVMTAGVEFTAVSGTAPEIVTATKRYGSYAMRVNTTATEWASYSVASANTTDDFYIRGYVRFTTRPNSQALLILAENAAGTDLVSIRYDNSSNTLELYNSEDGAQVGSDSTMVINTSTWYMLELKVDATTIGSTAVAARINNQEFASGTISLATGMDKFSVGAVSTNTTVDAHWDDFAINQGIGSSQNSFPGPGAIVHMQPDSNGDNTAWNVSVSCASVDYTCADEVPPNDATDAVGSSTANQVEEYGLEASSAAGIGANDRLTLVQVGVRYNLSAAGTQGAIRARLLAVNTGANVESQNLTYGSTTWVTNRSAIGAYPITAEKQPLTSTNWTIGTLDSAQVGVRLVGDPSTNNFQLTNIWLLVEYVPVISVSGTFYSNSTTGTGYNCSIIAANLGTSTDAGPTRTTLNDGTTMSCTAADGTFTVYADAPTDVGNPVAIFTTSTGVGNTTVTTANDTTSAMTNVDIRDTTVIVRHEYSLPITNATLGRADNGSSYFQYSVSSGTLTVDSGRSLLVGRASGGHTFEPGGAVVTNATGGDFRVDDSNTAVFDTGTNTIGGDVYVEGGSTLYINATLNVDGGSIVTSGSFPVVDTNAGTPTTTITGTGNIGGGSGPTINFYSLRIGFLSPGDVTLDSPIAVTTDLNLVDGTLNANQSMTVSDDIFGSGGNLTYTSGTPTITMPCTDNACTFGTSGGSGTWKTYNLTTSGTGTVTVQRSWTLAGDLTIGSGTTWTYTGTPTLTTNGTKQITGPGTKTLYGLQVAESGVGATTTIANATRIDGAITLGAGATDGDLTYSANLTYYGLDITTTTAGSSIAYSGTPTLYIYGNGSTTLDGSGTASLYNVNIGDGTNQAYFEPSITTAIVGSVTVNNSNNSRFRPSGSGTAISVSGGITCTGNGGVTYQDSPTVTFNATQTINCSTTAGLFNIASSGSSTITQSTAMTAAGDMDVGASSTWRANANLTVSGGAITGNGTLTYTSGTPTVSLNGTGDFGGNTAWTFYTLDFVNTGSEVTTTTTGTGGITVNNRMYTRMTGDGEFTPYRRHVLKAGGKTWTLVASGVGTSAPFQNESFRFEGETSTIKYTGTSATDVAYMHSTTTNYYYNLVIEPASDVTVSYKLPTAIIINNNLTMGRAGSGFDAGLLTVEASSNDPNVTVGGTFSCVTPLGDSNGTTVSLGAGTWTMGNFNATWCVYGVTYETGSTVLMALAGGTMTNTNTLYNVTIDPTSAGTVTSAGNYSIANQFSVASGDTYSINSGTTTTITSTGLEVTGTGTISGAGRIAFSVGSGGPGADGGVTITAITRFSLGSDMAATTFDARTYGNDVEVTSSAGGLVTLTCASGTYTLSGATSDFLVAASGAGNMAVNCSTGNPTWNIGGNLDYNGGGGGSESITTGSGTWTVSGNVDLTGGSITASSGHTLVMNGTTKTLTSNSQTWQNATLSGTITMATGVHTFNGDLTLSGTITCSTLCTITMAGTSNALVGGGNSIGNLTINPSSAGTITLQTSDLTVTFGFGVSTGDAFTIASGRTLTLNFFEGSFTLDGTLNGPGRITYNDSQTNAFPTTGTLANDIITRFINTTAFLLTLPARTDYQYVEIDNSGASAGRAVTAAGGTITVNDNLDIINTGADPSTTTLNLDANDPTFTVNGVTTIAANGILSAPSGGALNLKGNYSNSGTFTDNGGTVTLNGTGTQTLSGTMTGSSDFNNLTITNTSGSVSGCATSFTPGVAFGADATISGTYTITTGGVKVQYNSGSTYTVTNINWVGAIGNLIYFRNSNLSSGTWILNVSGTQTVQYVDVARSDATPGNDIDADDGTNNDCTNNTGWVFSAGINIAGSSNSSGGTVRVAVNGTEQAQTTTLAGSWSISGVSVSSGNVVVVYVEGTDSAETTGVSQYDGTGDMTGFVLDTNVLTIGNGDNQTIDLTDLAGYDCDNDEDVMFSSNSGTLAVQGCSNSYTDETLSVKASNALTVGNSQVVTTDNLINAGTLTAGSPSTFTVGGNWTNSSTFTYNSSTVTFTATDTGHTINNGASYFYNVVFDGSGGAWSPLTNTMTLFGDLTMTNGTFNTATGTADVTVLDGNVQCGATCGTINMSSTNTFKHSVSTAKAFGTNVAVATDWTFYNLTFDAYDFTPTITINGTGTGEINVLNTLATTLAGTSLTVDNETNDRIFDVDGAVSIAASTTLVASSTAAFTVGGNWTNNGNFTDGTGTVTLDGSSQQTLSGQLTGASDRFHDLVITNASGSDPETSPSVIFAASAETADDFIAQTASTKLRFLAGGTYTFQKVTFNGQATGTRVALRSSSTGTSWTLNVAGTRTVANTDVRDSNACGQAPDIDATDGTSFDATGNSCWQINTLTFSISDVTIGFGTLTTGAARWANGAATGSASATAAHTLAVATNARGGYALTYFGPTLSGPETITAATITGDADGDPGQKQFALGITTSGNGTIPSAYQQASNNYSFVPSTTITLMSETGPTATETVSAYYMCNIATTTLPGSYSTNVTYIVTTTF